MVDIIPALIQQPDYQTARKYWNKLKERLNKEGSQPVTNCHQLKLTAEDGKMRLTDVASPETLLRLVQSVPSPKAEPIKLWLAKVGYERMQDMADPVPLAGPCPRVLAAARQERKVDSAADDRAGNPQQADRLLERSRDQGRDGICHPDQHHSSGMGGITVKEHKALKGLKSQNLRDHMSEAELIFTALAELSTRQIAESMNATGMDENAEAGEKGRRDRKKRSYGTGKKDRQARCNWCKLYCSGQKAKTTEGKIGWAQQTQKQAGLSLP